MTFSWFSSIFSSGWQSGHSGPNQEFQKTMHEKVQTSSLPKTKKSKVGAGLTAAGSTIVIINTVKDVVAPAASLVNDVVRPVAGTIKDVVKENIIEPLTQSVAENATAIPGAEATSRAASVLWEGANDIFSYAKTAGSWGWWAFRLLPSGVQFGAGLLGLYLVYRWWNQGSTGGYNGRDVHVNITINGAPAGTPEIEQNGTKVDMRFLPQAIGCLHQTAPKNTPEEQAKQKWVKTVAAIQDRREAAAKLHKALLQHRESRLLSPHYEKIDGLLERFQAIQEANYAKPDVLPLVTEGREMINTIRRDLREQQQDIVGILRQRGG
jgi:hypothetical protein